jgi:VanZ family protein
MPWAPRRPLSLRHLASPSATSSLDPGLASADREALRRLALVGSAYLVLFAAIATLAPFELAWPERVELDFGLRRDDVLLNLLMLFPLGFVSGLGARAADRRGLRGLLLGVGLSLGLELVQAFLPVRHVSPFDVLANASGAWLGAVSYAWQRPWVDARLLSVLRARPPLAALPIALLPALWLDGLALYTPARGLLAVLLGVAGASVAAATWPARAHGLAVPARIAIWYLGGVLPALLTSPASRVSVIAFGLLCSVAAAAFLGEPAGARRMHTADAQRLALARCLPWLLAYLLAVAVWSPPLRHAPQWTLGFTPFGSGSQRTMLAFLEYLAAFTLFGYLHALLGGPARHGRFARVALHACVLGCGLELLRAAMFGRCASGTAVALLVVAAVSGACLHAAQRELALAPGPDACRSRADGAAV